MRCYYKLFLSQCILCVFAFGNAADSNVGSLAKLQPEINEPDFYPDDTFIKAVESHTVHRAGGLRARFLLCIADCYKLTGSQLQDAVLASWIIHHEEVSDSEPNTKAGYVIVQWRRAWYCLTHCGRDKMDNISQTTFSNVFSSMKMFEFRLTFHWSLFLRVQLTTFQHWFR